MVQCRSIDGYEYVLPKEQQENMTTGNNIKKLEIINPKMNQEIKYKANIEMKSQGSLSHVVEKLKSKFDDIKFTNTCILESTTSNFSFDIEINTDVHTSFSRSRIIREMFGRIFRTIFFENLIFKELKEEYEIYELD